MEATREEQLWTLRCEECDVIGWFSTVREAVRVGRQHEQANDDRHVVSVKRYDRQPVRV